MLSNFIHQLTAYLTLAIVMLVGGLGTGLHTVFDCCHHCQCVEECGEDRAACETEPKWRGDREAIGCCGRSCCTARTSRSSAFDAVFEAPLEGSADGCAICYLLSHFHSTVQTFTTEILIEANRESVLYFASTTFVASSSRLEPSRGPPACPFLPLSLSFES